MQIQTINFGEGNRCLRPEKHMKNLKFSLNPAVSLSQKTILLTTKKLIDVVSY